MSNSVNPLKYLAFAAAILVLIYFVIPFLFSAMVQRDYGTLRKALPAEQKAAEQRAKAAAKQEAEHPSNRRFPQD